MRRAALGLLFVVFFIGPTVTATSGGAEQKFLNRSIYLPVTFVLCEHLDDALYYENNQVISTMPVSRVFQFTYYPNLKQLRPSAIQTRVEGRYVDVDEPFVARVAVTPDGFFTADAHRPIDMAKGLRKLRYKVDVRLERVTLTLACDRFCSRKSSETVAGLSSASTGGAPKETPEGDSSSPH